MGHSLRTLLRVVRAGRWRELSEALGAQLALVRAQMLVWTRPEGSLVNPAPSTDSGVPRSIEQCEQAERLALGIVRASRFGVFGAQCLVRALALHRLLERYGIEGSVVRIGVRRAGGELFAHAWVELDGRILGDNAEHTGTFSLLTDVRVASPRG